MYYFSNLFDKFSTCFGQVHSPSTGVSQHCIHAIGICHAKNLEVGNFTHLYQINLRNNASRWLLL